MGHRIVSSWQRAAKADAQRGTLNLKRTGAKDAETCGLF
jgi:hypothetical protein